MGLTHFNDRGEAHMVDVGGKDHTDRQAVATGNIFMAEQTLVMIQNHDHKKGDVIGIARIAGIMAAKKTAELIPLCHPLSLTKITLDFDPADKPEPHIHCTATVALTGQTGVEMEALCAVQVALLTIYDMCKAVDRGMIISDVMLKEKAGGKSGDWARS